MPQKVVSALFALLISAVIGLLLFVLYFKIQRPNADSFIVGIFVYYYPLMCALIATTVLLVKYINPLKRIKEFLSTNKGLWLLVPIIAMLFFPLTKFIDYYNDIVFDLYFFLGYLAALLIHFRSYAWFTRNRTFEHR